MSRFERIALAGGLVMAAGWAAMYFGNPFRSPSWNPIPRVFGINVFRAAARSMAPTLNLGDIFVANSWPYVGRDPAVGNIVTFVYPRDPKVQYVKRIVAAGGDRIAISDCIVVLNGRELSEPYAVVNGLDTDDLCKMAEVEVPQGHYFVLGDNRLESADSRTLGFLPRKNILGLVED